MKATFILILIISLFLIAPSVAAVTTLTQDISDNRVILGKDLSVVNVNLSGADPLYNYTIYGTVGDNITGLPDTMIGEFFIRNVTGNGTYRFTLNPREYPYKMTAYFVQFHAAAYYKTNNTYIGSNISSTPAKFAVDGPTQTAYTTHFLFRDSVPASLSKGKQVVEDGVSVNVSCVHFYLDPLGYDPPFITDQRFNYTAIFAPTYKIWAFVTDNADPRAVLGYATFDVSTTSSRTASLFGRTYNYGIQDTVISFGAQFFEYNMSYNIYYGVRMNSAGLTTSNTFIDLPDKTLSPSLFSVSGDWGGPGVPRVGDVLRETSTEVNRYIGTHIYVETTATTSFNPMFATGNLGDWVRSYGNYMGLPWFYLAIAFLIIAICAVIPLSLSLKYDFDLPNFVYVITISIGVIVDWGVNLLDLWMAAFYFIVLIIGLIFTYKEDLGMIMSLPGYTFVRGQKVSSSEDATLKHSGYLSKAYLKDTGTLKEKTQRYSDASSAYNNRVPKRLENGRTLMPYGSIRKDTKKNVEEIIKKAGLKTAYVTTDKKGKRTHTVYNEGEK